MREAGGRSRVLLALAGLVGLAALTGCAGPATSGAAPAETSAAASAAPSRDTGKATAAQDPSGDQDGVSDAVDRSIRPVRVVIPSIGVDASLLDLQRGADGVLAAPPADRLDDAGWYTAGTVPGQVGPAVIAGHVDWVDRVAVFHRLGELRQGDAVEVVMSDRSTVRFTVDRTRAVAKADFPSKAVYGPTPDAQLRVITCGGPWDDARNIYSENVIVYASLQA